MHTKCVLAGLGVLLLLSFGAVSGAGAVTLQGFDSVDRQRQGEVMAAVLQAYYNHYAGNPETVYKANFLVDLYKPVVEGGNPHLLTLIVHELDIARADTVNSYTIESIVNGVIDRECHAP